MQDINQPQEIQSAPIQDEFMNSVLNELEPTMDFDTDMFGNDLAPEDNFLSDIPVSDIPAPVQETAVPSFENAEAVIEEEAPVQEEASIQEEEAVSEESCESCLPLNEILIVLTASNSVLSGGEGMPYDQFKPINEIASPSIERAMPRDIKKAATEGTAIKGGLTKEAYTCLLNGRKQSEIPADSIEHQVLEAAKTNMKLVKAALAEAKKAPAKTSTKKASAPKAPAAKKASAPKAPVSKAPAAKKASAPKAPAAKKEGATDFNHMDGIPYLQAMAVHGYVKGMYENMTPEQKKEANSARNKVSKEIFASVSESAAKMVQAVGNITVNERNGSGFRGYVMQVLSAKPLYKGLVHNVAKTLGMTYDQRVEQSFSDPSKETHTVTFYKDLRTDAEKQAHKAAQAAKKAA